MIVLLAIAAAAGAPQPADCSKACVERVKKRILRAHRRAEWRSYKRHPMPWCTWANESGPPRPGYGQWARARYRVVNTAGSGAGGKFQIMPQTWAAYGGTTYAPRAELASRRHQERVARRIAYTGTTVHRPQGLGAWVTC